MPQPIRDHLRTAVGRRSRRSGRTNQYRNGGAQPCAGRDGAAAPQITKQAALAAARLGGMRRF
jgi:hypothetical protein